MTAAPHISGGRAEPKMGPADAAFVSGLTAYLLPVVRDAAREQLLLSALKDLRPRLSQVPQIMGMALCFDALCGLTPWSEDWRHEYEDLRGRIVRFNEWRLGRAQEALRRQQY